MMRAGHSKQHSTAAPDEAWMDAYIAARCEEVGDCLEWQGAVSKSGPTFRTPRPHHQAVQVRRYLARKLGPLPDAARLRISTTCGNPRCVRREHLAMMTPRQLVRRAVKTTQGAAWRTAARVAKLQAAVRARKAKLTPELAAAIRAADGTCVQVGQAFGVGPSTVSAVRNHRVWRDVAGNPFAGLMRGVV